MAYLTITKTHVKFTCIVLVGPNNERIITGTNLPVFVPKVDIENVNVSISEQKEQARLAVGQRPQWKTEIWHISVVRDDEKNILASRVKIIGETKSVWANGWPYYTMPTPNDDQPARFSCKLIQKTLDNHKINLSQKDSYEVDTGKVQSILDVVDDIL